MRGQPGRVLSHPAHDFGRGRLCEMMAQGIVQKTGEGLLGGGQGPQMPAVLDYLSYFARGVCAVLPVAGIPCAPAPRTGEDGLSLIGRKCTMGKHGMQPALLGLIKQAVLIKR